jgi:hypothetical protein
VQTYNEGLGQRINSKVFFFLWWSLPRACQGQNIVYLNV